MKLKVQQKAAKVKIPQKTGGGATIADRFKLDDSAAAGGPVVGGTSLKFAFSFGLAALFCAIALVAMLYSHWDYMMPV